MKITLLIILLCTAYCTLAQYKTNVVLQEQHFYINSSTHVGGKTHVALPISLPANTIAWYYTYTAYRDQANIDAVRGRTTLVANMTKALAGVSLGATELVHQAVRALTAPPGGNNCDVYLLDRTGLGAFNQQGRWQYYSVASRENFVSGCVPVCAAELQQGEWYLGIRNTDAFHGIHVLVAVEAVVAEQPVSTGNTAYNASSRSSRSFNEQLVGQWRDDNSTFKLYANGSIAVKFDGQLNWAAGTWTVQGDRFYLTIGLESTTYRILSMSTNRFSYQDIKSGTSYSAQRFAE